MAQQPTPGRMEAFSDGVIAVIITIMVLELKVPAEAGFAGLRTVLPTLAVYAASFAFVGVYWVNHHHLIDKLEHTDALILWANLFFLFCLSLLPFFTAYLINTQISALSVQTYVASLLVTGFSFQLLSRSIVRHLRRFMAFTREQEKKEAAAQQHFAELAKGWLSVFLYIFAAVLAHWTPHTALTLAAAVTLLWVVPSLGLKLKPEAEPAVAGTGVASEPRSMQGDSR